MLARQRVACFGVVELLGGLPILHTVALCAVTTELALVWVVVARGAGARLREKRFRRVAILNQGLEVRQHVRRGVAFLAKNTGVFSLQLITSELMIEFFLRGFPMDEIEILAVVLQVAVYAIPSAGIGHLHPAVVTVMVGKVFGNFFVAVYTSKRGDARSKLMTACALRRAA